MYAVIKTGGKQYRVQPGDVLVVERLDGDPGAAVSFGDVLMLGDGEQVFVGAPMLAGAKVSATLIETRKGLKVKIFKKTRRQGYRRTRGHRQFETVLRVTGIDGEGKSAKWEGTVDLTTKAVLNARARNLKLPETVVGDAPAKPQKKTAPKAEAAAPAQAAKAKASPKPKAAAAEGAEKKPAAKKAAPKKSAKDAADE